MILCYESLDMRHIQPDHVFVQKVHAVLSDNIRLQNSPSLKLKHQVQQPS